MTRYDAQMQHSIVARHVAWPARYVHPTTRARERRLGLHAGASFTAAPSRRTVLRTPDIGPLAALRAPWRAIRPAPVRRRVSGRIAPVVGVHWTGTARQGGNRPAAAPAWRD